MLFYTFLVPFAVVFLSLIVGIIYHDRKSNDELVVDFSSNLRKWHDKGKYFMYKDVYKIFYIHERLNTAQTSQINNSDNEEYTIVLLHGFPTSSYDYSKIWHQFSQIEEDQSRSRINKKYTSILTLDYLGYGFSDKPQNHEYSIFDMADLVDSLLMHLNINRVALIAHDVSDTVTQELLRRDNLKNQNHFKIEKCILLNGGIFNDIYKPMLSQYLLRTRPVKNVFSKFFFQFLTFKFSFSRVFGSLGKPNDSEMHDFYLSIKYNYGNEILPLTIEYMSEREQYDEVWRTALNETTLPVMFIYGPADPINPSHSFPKKLLTELPNVKLSMLSSSVGHYPQFEDPFTVYELIRKQLV
jgi:pimeloyl-ACP methyl ester carboxylesterase